MSSDVEALAESLRNIAISCMPIGQRIGLGQQNANFREEERQIPYQIKVVHIDINSHFIEVNIDKHSFLLQQQMENVQATVSDGNGHSSVFNMPSELSLDESLKKITDYFLARPGTIIQQFFISSEKVLEKCTLPETVQQRYICYDSRNLEKAVAIKCPETFVYCYSFNVAMIRTVFEQFKKLNFTAGTALEIGSARGEKNAFTKALDSLKDLNPKRGLQPKHSCYDLECARPDIEYATTLQCLVFDMGNSDCEFVVCLPDRIQLSAAAGSNGLNHITRFQVVQKGSTLICDEEDWLSVFDVDGFTSFVNMA